MAATATAGEISKMHDRPCLRCGLEPGYGAYRLCATCCPPAPWWAHLTRNVYGKPSWLRRVMRLLRGWMRGGL